MQPAIRVENLGKSYRIAHAAAPRERYKTLRDSLTNLAMAPLRRLRNGGGDASTEEFWALKDVSFEVQPGEVVGIIGRNGAGKSTLLKILSRITKPTTGRVTLNGRVGSLLEVGTGFHPELTGRENVFLNGSILGMSRSEIARRFDEIVAFAEVEKFLDTPVKRYSSGMYVRLAFAVAAHLEPEILIVDEVLAVGDAIFQRRCLDKLSKLARGGLTVLFVSHNMDLITKFCSRTLWLNRGQIVGSGSTRTVCDAYVKQMVSTSGGADLKGSVRTGDGRARFSAVRFLDDHDNECNFLYTGERLRCVMDIRSSASISNVMMAVVIKTIQGSRLVTSWTEEVGFATDLEAGMNRFECSFEQLRIRPGRQVVIELWLYEGCVVDWIEEACVLDVIERGDCGFSSRDDQGNMLCDYRWARHPIQDLVAEELVRDPVMDIAFYLAHESTDVVKVRLYLARFRRAQPRRALSPR